MGCLSFSDLLIFFISVKYLGLPDTCFGRVKMLHLDMKCVATIPGEVCSMNPSWKTQGEKQRRPEHLQGT
jgi:hypothetical protein